MSEIDPKLIGVCYRKGPITDADYEEAIQALQDALDLDDSKGCPVCHDAHSAAQCHHNPLVLARQWTAATSVYACYHCGFVAANDEEALAHFGPPGQEKPACQNTPDADLIDRLRALARQRQQQPLEPFRIPLETHSEWIAADRIAALLSAVAKIKDLAVEAYAKEFPLSGGDVAGCLAEAKMLTRDEFIALVEKHDPDVAAALRVGPPQAEPGDFDEDARIPF